MSDVWTPMGFIPPDTKETYPFDKLAKESAKLGFLVGVSHDSVERVIQLQFLAKTDKAKAICASALDNPEGDRLMVGMQYREGDNPLLATAACWEMGMQTIRSAS